MKNPGKEVIDVIEKITSLDWFRCTGFGFDEVSANTIVVVWRFKSIDPNELTERIICSLRLVLQQFAGNLSWSLKFTGRNWVLRPTEVQELEDSERFRTDGELLAHLRSKHPDLGRRACEDLAAIAEELARQLESGIDCADGAKS